MTRLLYRVYRWISGARYRLVRRFTPAGLFVLALLICLTAVGTDIERTVAHSIFAILLGLVFLAAVFVPFFRGRFAVERELPRCGSVGEPMTYTIRATNLSGKVRRGMTVLDTLVDQRMSIGEFAGSLRPTPRTRTFQLRVESPGRRKVEMSEGELPVLLAGGTGEARVRLTPIRRGVLRFQAVCLARTDPFGLIRSFISCPASQTLAILPRRYPLPGLVWPGTPRYQPGGLSMASRVGASDEFASLREYRHGDPLRHVHWKSWARVGRPIVKEFQDEWFTRHALVLDTFTEQDNERVFEEAVSVAASFAATVRTQESLLDLMLVGPRAYCFTAGRGLAHTEQMLEILAAVCVTPDASLETLRHLVMQHAGSLSGAICVFVAWDAPRQELVRGLLAGGVPVLVLVLYGEQELEPKELGPMAACPRHFRTIRVGEVEKALAGLQDLEAS